MVRRVCMIGGGDNGRHSRYVITAYRRTYSSNGVGIVDPRYQYEPLFSFVKACGLRDPLSIVIISNYR